MTLHCDSCDKPLGDYLHGKGGIEERAHILGVYSSRLPDIVCNECWTEGYTVGNPKVVKEKWEKDMTKSSTLLTDELREKKLKEIRDELMQPSTPPNNCHCSCHTTNMPMHLDGTYCCTSTQKEFVPHFTTTETKGVAIETVTSGSTLKESDIVSDCCHAEYDAFGFPKDDGLYQEKCLKCGKPCEPIFVSAQIETWAKLNKILADFAMYCADETGQKEETDSMLPTIEKIEAVISQAITADREALIQRIEKAKITPLSKNASNLSHYNKGLDLAISIIKE